MLRLQRPICAATAIMLVTMAAAGCADNSTESEDTAVGSTTTTVSSSPPSPSTPAPAPAPAPATPTAVPPAPRVDPPAPPAALPPFIASTTWGDSEYGVTLRITPTPSARQATGTTDAAQAWSEVVASAPDADTPGMWEQVDCHWTWARILEPDKKTWNIEPWRPDVPADRMLLEGCNPGGPEV